MEHNPKPDDLEEQIPDVTQQHEFDDPAPQSQRVASLPKVEPQSESGPTHEAGMQGQEQSNGSPESNHRHGWSGDRGRSESQSEAHVTDQDPNQDPNTTQAQHPDPSTTPQIIAPASLNPPAYPPHSRSRITGGPASEPNIAVINEFLDDCVGLRMDIPTHKLLLDDVYAMHSDRIKLDPGLYVVFVQDENPPDWTWRAEIKVEQGHFDELGGNKKA